MSLRAFHIVFIVTALALLTFMAYWSGHRVLRGEDGQNTVMAVSSILALLVGIPYLTWFVRKKSPAAIK